MYHVDRFASPLYSNHGSAREGDVLQTYVPWFNRVSYEIVASK